MPVPKRSFVLIKTEQPEIASQEAINDEHLVRLWLHGRPANTIENYARDIRQFLDFIDKPIKSLTLADLQIFSDALVQYADGSKKRKLYAVKSLIAFAHRLGYLVYDTGAPLKIPALKDTLAERILSEHELATMLALETDERNHAILRLLYSTGIRVSEMTALTWRDFTIRNNGSQVVVFGKGGKTRTIRLSKATTEELLQLQKDRTPDDPIFRSKKGGSLGRVQVYRIVKKAAEKAGLWQKVSPHWMRHAHASHALDAGAPIHLVQATLGHASVATTGRYTHARPNESSSDYLDV
ncbi:MAG: tyrosine-type recombinase/integrase [Bacteroidetes Order II. Incertae sedis bacterium]|nr:tyrosine-type recombinase/integrase [Bacteroidetes Order II. bacterium]